MQPIFKNREEAGLHLSAKLLPFKNAFETIVLGIPRGGVPVAYQIAKQLRLPLDIILSKKIGHPSSPEFAIGAVTENLIIVDEAADVTREYIDEEVKRIRRQLSQRNALFRQNRPPLDVKDKTIIVVDDGIATGNTLLVTLEMLRKAKAAKLIVASPVVPLDRVEVVKNACDEFVFLHAAEYFQGVGAFYDNFEQVSDDEVAELLNSTSK